MPSWLVLCLVLYCSLPVTDWSESVQNDDFAIFGIAQNSRFWLFWILLGALWHIQMALPGPQNCSNSSLGMCRDLFHPCFTLFHQFGATRSAYGRKSPVLAVLDPVWQPSGTPTWPSLTRETVTAKNYLKKYFSAATFLIHDKCVVLRVCAKLVDTYHCDMSFARCWHLPKWYLLW